MNGRLQRSGSQSTSAREVRTVACGAYLVDDSTAGFPKSDAVLGGSSTQKVVDFLVDFLGTGQVLFAAQLGLDQVIAMDGGRDGHPRKTTRNELHHRHLGGGVLHPHPVGSQSQVTLSTLDVLLFRIVQVRV